MSDFDPSVDFFIISLKNQDAAKSDSHSITVNKLLKQFELIGYDVAAFNREEVRTTARIMSKYLNIANVQKRFVTSEDLEVLKMRLCKEFGIPSVEVFESKTRKAEVVVARQLYYAMLRKDNYGSLADIGASCGKKDHATVLHAVNAINTLLIQKNPAYYESVMRIIRFYDMELLFGIVL